MIKSITKHFGVESFFERKTFCVARIVKSNFEIIRVKRVRKYSYFVFILFEIQTLSLYLSSPDFQSTV